MEAPKGKAEYLGNEYLGTDPFYSCQIFVFGDGPFLFVPDICNDLWGRTLFIHCITHHISK